MNYLKELLGDEQYNQVLKTYSIRELTAHPEYLLNVKGVGPKTIEVLQAGIELARQSRYETHVQIDSPARAAAYFISYGLDLLDREEFWVIPLDAKNHVQGHEVIYKGNINTCIIRVAEVIRPCVIKNSTAFIIGHNHPSGTVTPSPEDVSTSNKIGEAAKLFGIELLDSIIVSAGEWQSLKELGRLN